MVCRAMVITDIGDILGSAAIDDIDAIPVIEDAHITDGDITNGL